MAELRALCPAFSIEPVPSDPELRTEVRAAIEELLGNAGRLEDLKPPVLKDLVTN